MPFLGEKMSKNQPKNRPKNTKKMFRNVFRLPTAPRHGLQGGWSYHLRRKKIPSLRALGSKGSPRLPPRSMPPKKTPRNDLVRDSGRSYEWLMMNGWMISLRLGKFLVGSTVALGERGGLPRCPGIELGGKQLVWNHCRLSLCVFCLKLVALLFFCLNQESKDSGCCFLWQLLDSCFFDCWSGKWHPIALC